MGKWFLIEVIEGVPFIVLANVERPAALEWGATLLENLGYSEEPVNYFREDGKWCEEDYSLYVKEAK